MAQICSHGGLDLRPPRTGKRPALLDLIIYVHFAALPSLKGSYQVRTEIVGEAVNFCTSGVSPTALCDGAA